MYCSPWAAVCVLAAVPALSSGLQGQSAGTLRRGSQSSEPVLGEYAVGRSAEPDIVTGRRQYSEGESQLWQASRDAHGRLGADLLARPELERDHNSEGELRLWEASRDARGRHGVHLLPSLTLGRKQSSDDEIQFQHAGREARDELGLAAFLNTPSGRRQSNEDELQLRQASRDTHGELATFVNFSPRHGQFSDDEPQRWLSSRNVYDKPLSIPYSDTLAFGYPPKQPFQSQKFEPAGPGFAGESTPLNFDADADAYTPVQAWMKAPPAKLFFAPNAIAPTAAPSWLATAVLDPSATSSPTVFTPVLGSAAGTASTPTATTVPASSNSAAPTSSATSSGRDILGAVIASVVFCLVAALLCVGCQLCCWRGEAGGFQWHLPESIFICLVLGVLVVLCWTDAFDDNTYTTIVELMMVLILVALASCLLRGTIMEDEAPRQDKRPVENDLHNLAQPQDDQDRLPKSNSGWLTCC